MSNYSRGARIERKARDLLESAGWLVFRSAGSLSAFDLVAVPSVDLADGGDRAALLVQVRSAKVASALRRAMVDARDAIDALIPQPAARLEVWGWLLRRGFRVWRKDGGGWIETDARHCLRGKCIEWIERNP